jgi:hypothetical protein
MNPLASFSSTYLRNSSLSGLLKLYIWPKGGTESFFKLISQSKPTLYGGREDKLSVTKMSENFFNK